MNAIGRLNDLYFLSRQWHDREEMVTRLFLRDGFGALAIEQNSFQLCYFHLHAQSIQLANAFHIIMIWSTPRKAVCPDPSPSRYNKIHPKVNEKSKNRPSI